MGTNEETRKIQFTGKSSYIVSLPKQWIMDMGLKQGDQVTVLRQGTSTLQITPLKHHTKTINTEDATNNNDEVDRFNFYIIRQLKIAIQNEHMLKDMGIENARSCLGYRLIVKNIERVGDHATDIVKDLLEFKKPIKKSVLDTIHEMNNFALSVLDDACLSLFKRDFAQAELTVKRTADITKYEKKMLESTKSLRDDEEVYRVRRMAENIRRISEYASDIAEIVMNMTIEKTLRKQ